MKDLPHHIQKLNRRIIRSMHQEEGQEEQLPDIPTWPETKRQQRKKAKIKMRKEGLARPSSHPSPEERNKIMKGGRKGRVPVFDQNKGTPPLPTKLRKKTVKKTRKIP